MPLTFPFAATVIVAKPTSSSNSPLSTLHFTLPVNVPVAHVGNASVLSVIVAVCFSSPFFATVNVTVNVPAFVGTP